MNDYRDALAVCPFYRGQDKQIIACEGVTRFGTVRLHFRRIREKEAWVRDKCNDIKGCEACPIYRGKAGD